MKIEYFGTDLTTPGHYFWTLEGSVLGRSERQWSELPFNPENFPVGKPNECIMKGDTEFHIYKGYSILAIAGSCADSRGGTHHS